MITDSRRQIVVSSLGWVDRDALWVYHVDSDRTESVQLGHAEWIQIIGGDGEHFATVQNSRGGGAIISVRRFDAIAEVQSVAEIMSAEGTLKGTLEVWKHVPTAYIAHPYLVRLFPEEGRWERQEMPWYDDTYDKGYQGIVGVTQIPDQKIVIVSVQRDSNPVLYDPESKRSLGKLSLAGCYGNPKLKFRIKANELWADDYDTLIRIRPADWQTIASLRLQDSAKGTRHFIGEWNFNSGESICSVARPFSGDVLFLDTESFAVCGKCTTGSQPLEAILIDGLGIIVRDWKSGQLLRGAASGG